MTKGGEELTARGEESTTGGEDFITRQRVDNKEKS